jgi:hypothetical protein
MSKNTSFRVHVQTATQTEVNDVIYFIQRTQNHKY